MHSTAFNTPIWTDNHQVYLEQKTRKSLEILASLDWSFPRGVILKYYEVHKYKTHSSLSIYLYLNSTSFFLIQFSSVQFSRSVVSDTLRSHGLQHARLSCASPTPGAYSNSHPSHWWCHPTSSSVVLFSSSPKPSQHQGFFQWVNSSHEVAKVLDFQLQYQSFQ